MKSILALFLLSLAGLTLSIIDETSGNFNQIPTNKGEAAFDPNIEDISWIEGHIKNVKNPNNHEIKQEEIEEVRRSSEHPNIKLSPEALIYHEIYPDHPNIKLAEDALTYKEHLQAEETG